MKVLWLHKGTLDCFSFFIKIQMKQFIIICDWGRQKRRWDWEAGAPLPLQGWGSRREEQAKWGSEWVLPLRIFLLTPPLI